MPRTVTPPVEDVLYPESDGKPLGESGFHSEANFFLLMAAKVRYGGAEDVFFASNMFLYYEEGNPRANVAPDFMVVKGVSGEQRKTFKVWEEGGAIPCVIVEVASKSTCREDENEKFALYARLGVAEYYLFDPIGEFFDPRFRGFRLVDGVYEPMEPDAEGALTSVELGIRLRLERNVLRVYDAVTGQLYRTPEEVMELLEREADATEIEYRRAEREARRAESNARLAESKSQLAESNARLAEAETKRAEANARRAEAEAKRAELADRRAKAAIERADEVTREARDLAAEVARLSALLDTRDHPEYEAG
jgi:Uma2 family endonuclease